MEAENEPDDEGRVGWLSLALIAPPPESSQVKVRPLGHVVLFRGCVPRNVAGMPIFGSWIASAVVLVAGPSAPGRPLPFDVAVVWIGWGLPIPPDQGLRQPPFDRRLGAENDRHPAGSAPNR